MQISRVRYPVVVVGSGPTGLTVANLLGKEGIALLLVDKNPNTVEEPRAVSIDDESLRTMQALGLVQDILQQVVRGYGSHYYSSRGWCFAKVEPAGMPYGYPRRNAFSQPILEQQLRLGLGRFPNVSTLYGWELQACSQTHDGVRLTLRCPQGIQHYVSCDYLVGADGSSSTVREQLDIPLDGMSSSDRWLIIDLVNFRNRSRHTKVFCNHHRPCVTLPGPHSTRRYEFKLHAHERDEDFLNSSAITSLLATHEGDPEATILRTAVYRFHARVAPNWYRGRIVLAGDAVHLMPPFAGQGMNSGIRDAHSLSWRLAAILRGQAGRGLLDSYQAERYEHVWQMIRLAERMGRIMAPRGAWSELITQLGFLALKLCPAAREYITQMNYKPSPRFSNGFIIKSSRRRTLAGRLFPQPNVITREGETVPFDEILGNRFVVVARTDQPTELFAALTHSIWDRLGARRIAVLPEGCDDPAAPSVTCVRECEDVLARTLDLYPKHILVLRPDHYVLACTPASEIDECAAEIEALLDGTFTNTK